MSNNPTKMFYVAKFGATWCPSCQQMHDYLKEQPLNIDNVILEEIDVDENEKLSDDLKVSYLPTVVIFDDDNKEVSRRSGYLRRQELVDFIKQSIEQ